METKREPKHETWGGRRDSRRLNPPPKKMQVRKGNKNRRTRPVGIFTLTTMCVRQACWNYSTNGKCGCRFLFQPVWPVNSLKIEMCWLNDSGLVCCCLVEKKTCSHIGPLWNSLDMAGVRESYQDHGQHCDGQSAETWQQSTPGSHF